MSSLGSAAQHMNLNRNGIFDQRSSTSRLVPSSMASRATKALKYHQIRPRGGLFSIMSSSLASEHSDKFRMSLNKEKNARTSPDTASLDVAEDATQSWPVSVRTELFYLSIRYLLPPSMNPCL
mmetsp:Transcript_60766/g.72165  ORF Transcript_60766/g.72165 Transcript_60766/m.72165 type:complete len:123 (+) Transcript_60766:149-517(+)